LLFVSSIQAKAVSPGCPQLLLSDVQGCSLLPPAALRLPLCPQREG